MKKNRISVNITWIAICCLFVISCENEKAEVEKVTYQENLPVEITYESEIFYSENAELKVKAYAPEMHRYVGEKNYSEMPKGVEVIFYDSAGVESSRLTANYAIDKQEEFIMEAKGDVVVTNAEGERLNTEHLIWNRKTRLIHSNVRVTMTTEDETIIGDGFESNETFTKYKIIKSRGVLTQTNEDN